ncbi:MAG: 5-formyltetrahydrofolate cyclo-ligase [Bdellovibrionota bacterium]
MTADIATLRKSLLERRRNLGPQALLEIGAKATARVTSALEGGGLKIQGLRVALYRAMHDELSLDALDTWLRARGARIYFPRVLDRAEKVLEFVEVPAALDASWRSGPYGISEPHPELQAAKSSELELIFVPGAGFGQQGERIGMGKGYYDRALTQAPEALRAAMTAETLIEPSLPQNSWDQPVQWIVTDQREIRTGAASRWFERRGA